MAGVLTLRNLQLNLDDPEEPDVVASLTIRLTDPAPYLCVGQDKPSFAVFQGLFVDSAQENALDGVSGIVLG